MVTVNNPIQSEFPIDALLLQECETELNIPHELRNVAQILKLYLQLMKRECCIEPNEKKLAQLNILLTQSERLVELADHIKHSNLEL